MLGPVMQFVRKRSTQVREISSHVTFPSLETERLIVRAVRNEDAPFLHSCLYSDPEVMKLYRYGKPYTEEESNRYVDDAVQIWEQGAHFGMFVVENKASKEILGEILLEQTSEPGQAEISYLFARKAQGLGFAKESIKAVGIQYAFDLFKNKQNCNGKKFNKIMATVHPDNLASEAIITGTLGMSLCGETEKFDASRKIYSRRLLE